MRERGDVVEADQVVEACASISGRPAAPQYPKLAVELVLSKWDQVREDVLEPLAAAINGAI
jgi:hypothetical protein